MTASGAGASSTVLFDWNGTVVLDEDRAMRALNRVLIDRGLAPLDVVGFHREFHLPMIDMFRRLGVDDVCVAEAEWNAEMAAESTVAREGTDALRLLHAAGVRLGVVSAASDTAVRADMTALELGGLWHSVDAPATDKLDTLRSRRGVEKHAFYVGDTAYDMRCALDAGFTPIGVDRGYTDVDSLMAAGAAAIISSFDELPRLTRAVEAMSAAS